jgi:precorrin-6A/cobalt-precorrin-6A reductase
MLTGERGFDIVSSLAGRVRDPVLPSGPVRIGGFGGAEGLRTWLADNKIDVLVDATHPFAGTMSAHAAAAASELGLPLLHVRRGGWREELGDRWRRVADLASAADAVAEQAQRVFLTIGRQGVAEFAHVTDAWFLIRAIDPPTGALPPRHELLLARGPFALEAEIRLMSDRRIDVLVTKDSGGELTAAKLAAARARGIPVVMIDRPPLPPGAFWVETAAAASNWLRTGL